LAAADTTTTPASSEIVIAPPGRWASLDLRDLWQHRELLYFLTKRELQVRYKQSFFGVSWALLQPLVLAGIFAFIFGKILTTDSEIAYPVFVISGLVPWLFFSQSVSNAAGSLVLDANLISKVYFPRLALPLSKALSLILDLVIAFVIVLVAALLWDVGIKWTAVFVPLFVGLGVLSAFAVGTFLAAVNVKYRDVALVVPMIIQVMLFISPVLYAVDAFNPGDWIYLWAVNPMVSVLEGIRWALFGTDYPGRAVIGISAASCLVMLAIALTYFKRAERFFADVI
jgi:lipopolysaccharide transport system permease protein